MPTIPKTFKVYKLEPHKLFAEEEGPYYELRTIQGYFLRETDIEEDSEDKCIEVVATSTTREVRFIQDFVILPVYHKSPIG